MTDEVAVAVGEGLSQLGKNRASVRLSKGTSGDDAVVKGSFLAKIGDDKEMRVGVKDVMDLKDVRVRGEDLKDLRLFVEAFTVDRVVQEVALVDGFDGKGGEGGW